MTKVILDVDELNNSLMFDCLNHAGDTAICRAVSALCGVLAIEATRIGAEPTVYEDGHVRIDLFNVSIYTHYVFQDVFEVFRQLAEQFPEHVRIY